MSALVKHPNLSRKCGSKCCLQYGSFQIMQCSALSSKTRLNTVQFNVVCENKGFTFRPKNIYVFCTYSFVASADVGNSWWRSSEFNAAMQACLCASIWVPNCLIEIHLFCRYLILMWYGVFKVNNTLQRWENVNFLD